MQQRISRHTRTLPSGNWAEGRYQRLEF